MTTRRPGRQRVAMNTKFLPFSGTSVQYVALDFEYKMALTDLVMPQGKTAGLVLVPFPYGIYGGRP